MQSLTPSVTPPLQNLSQSRLVWELLTIRGAIRHRHFRANCGSAPIIGESCLLDLELSDARHSRVGPRNPVSQGLSKTKKNAHFVLAAAIGNTPSCLEQSVFFCFSVYIRDRPPVNNSCRWFTTQGMLAAWGQRENQGDIDCPPTTNSVYRVVFLSSDRTPTRI